MESKVVREIPANPFLRDARKLKKNLRVAAYCRVSTEEEEQQSSFEIQGLIVKSSWTDKRNP